MKKKSLQSTVVVMVICLLAAGILTSGIALAQEDPPDVTPSAPTIPSSVFLPTLKGTETTDETVHQNEPPALNPGFDAETYMPDWIVQPRTSCTSQWCGSSDSAGTVYRDGNVGIGNSTPYHALNVTGQYGIGTGGYNRPAMQNSNWGYNPAWRTLILGSPSTIYSQNETGSVTLAFGVDVSGNPNGAFAGDGRELLFRNGAQFVTPNAANNGYHLDTIVLKDGNVGIGTLSPSHKLAVDGTVRAKEVIVDTGWSDFVFEEDYDLRSLAEVSEFIETHGHLPDVPSAADVAANGVSVGEMESILLQKVEELTLYLIQQDEQLAEQQRQNELLLELLLTLQEENAQLQERLTALESQ